MAKILYSKLNPVPFYDYSVSDAGKNVFLADKVMYEHTVQPHEGYMPYAQKWVRADVVNLQFWLQDIDICEIDITDCTGMVLSTFSGIIAVNGLILAGEVYNIKQFSFNTASLPDEFFFLLRVGVTGNPALSYKVSNRQHVLAELKPSLLFKYSNSHNHLSAVFKTPFASSFKQVFYFRVEGRLHDLQPSGEFEAYDDQITNTTMLGGKPYDTATLAVGWEYGVPEWVASLLNFIRTCNEVYLDQYQITAAEKIEKKSQAGYTRYLYETPVRMAKVENAVTTEICVPVTAPTTYAPGNAIAGVAYSYSYVLAGSQPISIHATNLPAWATAAISGNTVTITGTPASGDVGANVQFNVTVKNQCSGNLILAASINVAAANTCTPVAFSGSPSLPNATVNATYDATFTLTGTAPFTLSQVVKPAWMTIVINGNEIDFSGTPPAAASAVPISFSVSNCGGPPANTINFSQNINVVSVIGITGYVGPYSTGQTTGGGTITGPAGTLVTVNISATGNPSGTYTLSVFVAGVTTTGTTSVTNGATSFTFIMPVGGLVYWGANFSGTDSAGTGNISVS